MNDVKVLIVNQANLICNLISFVLGQEPDIKVIGTANTIAEALALANKCDIMLVDATLPENGALELSIKVGKEMPQTHVIITGVEKSPKTIIKYIESGASGYVLEEYSLEEMVEQVRSVTEGKAVVDPEINAELIARLSELADICADQETINKNLNSLSQRETEVLNLIREGKSNAEIGEALHIETGTVKNHVHNILNKLGVPNRRAAAKLAE